MTEQPAAPAAPGTPAAPAPGAAPAAPASAPAAAAPAAAPAAAENKPWWDGKITEPEIIDYAKAKNYQSPEEALRAAWSANKMNKLSPDITAVLEGKATPEQEAAFYKTLGRPESPDKYEFKHPDGFTPDADLEKLGRNIFHTLGASPAKAQAAMDMWNKAVAEKTVANTEAARVANEAALSKLSETWGGDLEKNRAAGERVMRTLNLSPEFMEKIEGQVGSATVVELLAKIGRASDEGGLKGGGDGGGGGDVNNVDAMSPEQAQARIDALNNDTEFQKKYKSKDNPEHVASVQLMEKLFAKAGTKKTS